MERAADPPRQLHRVRPRTERRSLRRLRVQANLPRYAVYAIAVAAVVHYALGSLKPAPAPRMVQRAPSVDLAAEAFALDFTRAYLTYQGADPQQHEAALARYVGSGGGPLDQDAGLEPPATGSDRVRFAEVLGDLPQNASRQITVEADTTALGTVYLSLTLTSAASGALELVGLPALVGPPAIAAAVSDSSDDGKQISDPAVTSVVSRALSNYLKGDASDLQPDLAPGAEVRVPAAGLGSIQVEQINWASPGHSVGVDVQASDAGATLTLHYTVSLTRQGPAEDRWFVSGIDSESQRPRGGP